MIRVECWLAGAKEEPLPGPLVYFVLVPGVCEGGDQGDKGARSPPGVFRKWPDPGARAVGRCVCGGGSDSLLKGVRSVCGIPTPSFGRWEIIYLNAPGVCEEQEEAAALITVVNNV